MNTEMENLLTRLDELMMEAHEKGYTFVFEKVLPNTFTIEHWYSVDGDFSIDIEEV